MIIIVILFILLALCFRNRTETFSSPQRSFYTSFPGLPRYSENIDLYDKSKHVYPYTSYSLYGLDDYGHLYTQNRAKAKYQQIPWAIYSQGRPSKQINLGGDLEITGLPSYFFRSQYSWPQGYSEQEKAVRQLGENKAGLVR